MTQDNLIALKPCPLCDSARTWVQNGDIPLPLGGWQQLIWCEACGCRSGEYATEAEAVAAWNTRTIERLSPPLDHSDLIARLKAHEDNLPVYNCGELKADLAAARSVIERLSPPPKAKPRRKKEGPCGCDVDPFGCERHPS